jgi:glycosyltransferase involved in cell wall biosynthesis
LLSLVLPCYNPPEGWDAIVAQSYRTISSRIDKPVELIIVNDGSAVQLNTPQLLALQQAYQGRIHFIDSVKNEGKGAALRKGVAATSYGKIIYTDIDFPYEIASVMDIYLALEQNNDIVVGVKGESYYIQVPKMRKAISKTLRRCIRLFLNMPITDTQCGLKGFNSKGKKVFLQTTINRYLFDLEFVYKGFKQKPALRIIEQPISLRAGVEFRSMNMKILWSEGVNFFKILLRSHT